MMLGRSKDNLSMYYERSARPTREAAAVHTVMILLTGLILALLAWSLIARIPEVARTRGQIIPAAKVQSIQSYEGGQIVELMVAEGETVAKGQPIARFEPVKAETDVKQLLSRTASLELEAERLQAFAEDRYPDFSKYQDSFPELVAQQAKQLSAQKDDLLAQTRVFVEQLAQKQRSIDTIRNKLPMLASQLESSMTIVQAYQKLKDEKITSNLEYLNAQQRATEYQKELEGLHGAQKVLDKEMLEIREKMKRLVNEQQSLAETTRSKVLADLNEANERLTERQASLDRMVINSPANGIVKSLPFATPGAVIKPGEVLAEIVPLDNPLIIEIQISPKDIGFVRTGQPATIRVDTYDYSRYGTLEGTLTHVSPTTFTGPKGELYYDGKVAPAKSFLGFEEKRNRLLPGMTADVDIVTGEKTVFEYLLKPVYTLRETAFRER
jgi:HlyD family type I secretion membrane fusion protein